MATFSDTRNVLNVESGGGSGEPQPGIYSNLSATGSPNSSSDATQGYLIGSRWVDIVNDQEYVCVSNESGNAIWKQTTVIIDDTQSRTDATWSGSKINLDKADRIHTHTPAEITVTGTIQNLAGHTSLQDTITYLDTQTFDYAPLVHTHPAGDVKLNPYTGNLTGVLNVEQMAGYLDALTVSGAVINDNSASDTETWSGSKISNEISTATSGISTVQINDLSNNDFETWSGSKIDSEITTAVSGVSGGGVTINDTTPSTTQTYSSNKIEAGLSTKALIFHSHDGTYAPVSHTHPEYALTSHNHNGTYTTFAEARAIANGETLIMRVHPLLNNNITPSFERWVDGLLLDMNNIEHFTGGTTTINAVTLSAVLGGGTNNTIGAFAFTNLTAPTRYRFTVHFHMVNTAYSGAFAGNAKPTTPLRLGFLRNPNINVNTLPPASLISNSELLTSVSITSASTSTIPDEQNISHSFDVDANNNDVIVPTFYFYDQTGLGSYRIEFPASFLNLRVDRLQF